MRLILMFIYVHLTYIPSFHHFRIQSLIFRWHPRSLHRHIHPQFVRGGLLDRSGHVWNIYAEENKTMIDLLQLYEFDFGNIAQKLLNYAPKIINTICFFIQIFVPQALYCVLDNKDCESLQWLKAYFLWHLNNLAFGVSVRCRVWKHTGGNHGGAA